MRKLTIDYLNKLKPSYIEKGYTIPKWITFSEQLINDGWNIILYRSKSTVSKYLFIFKNELKFKIRFSNHKANYLKEKEQDCDFYVGVGNKGVITTEQLLDKILTFKN